MELFPKSYTRFLGQWPRGSLPTVWHTAVSQGFLKILMPALHTGHTGSIVWANNTGTGSSESSPGDSNGLQRGEIFGLAHGDPAQGGNGSYGPLSNPKDQSIIPWKKKF